jgi:phosphotransferase system enzyme I (PtsI)
MKELKGIPASKGVALGPVFKYESVEIDIPEYTIEDTFAEWSRFQDALQIGRKQLEALAEKTRNEIGEEEAAIFEAHSMMLEDPELMESVHSQIDLSKTNAEFALNTAVEEYAAMLEALDDEYLQARATDIRDVGTRIIRILMGVDQDGAKALDKPSIIVARDLTPSDTAMLDKSLVLGFCTSEGGATSHTAILARSLGLPAVLGAGDFVLELETGVEMIIDGSEGVIMIDPDSETAKQFVEEKEIFEAVTSWALKHANESAETKDGHKVIVASNIGDADGARSAVKFGAEGVGLLRTEFLYLERPTLPNEEEQYDAYVEIVDIFDGKEVVLRTMDIGGDKELPAIEMPHEMNPFLGQRALRLALARENDLLKPQLRAVLRAAAGRNLKVMFPMVATRDEILLIRKKLDICREELKAEGKELPTDMEVGIMVEIPAAAVMADQLADEVDFFSIGTNDLTQYTMAADRTNASVSYLINGLQPAVLRLIDMVIKAAHKKGKWVGMCGELAGEPLAIPILLGLGLDEFSMNPPAVPIAKQVIRSLSYEEAKIVAEKALNLENFEAIQAMVKEEVAAVEMKYLYKKMQEEK